MKVDAPVAITLMGAGGFRGRNPLTTGMIGMHGTQASNMAVDGCDLLIAVGCRFGCAVSRSLGPSICQIALVTTHLRGISGPSGA